MMANTTNVCFEGMQGTSLSPSTEEHFNFLLQAVQAGEAHLQQDNDGKVQIVYENEKRIPLTHVDKSKAHTIQEGKTAEDVRIRVDVCLEMIEAIKETRTPSGVVIDRSKVQTSAQGKYEEGKQFERLQEVLGKGNCAGDIVVVKDNKTGTEHAVKTVMISEFSPDEVRAWVNLGESESFPSLYLFRLIDNKIVLHMEKIEHGVTLDDIINQHMANLWQKAPDLIRPFSLCMFHGLLSAVKEMHDKNWSHCDLHGGNVMMTKDTMTLKMLDFGMAKPLRQGFNFNHDGLKNDILNAIRLFCGLYIGQDFENNFVLEREIKSGTLKKTLLETSGLKESEKDELLQLIAMTYHVTQDPKQAGYGDTTPVLEHIEHTVYPDKMKDVLRKAAAILFPDYYYGARDIDLQARAEVTDGRGDREDEDKVDAFEFDLDAAAAAVPEELLNRLRISL
ncbi:hypothetical protein V1264_009120 [Littorina saxatilis]|uniref:Protein kinase domain-containing protein n=1 Tax=Littorina saxatilis TaxID=31220 RepID=A0AAN9AQR6_9CAEN